MPYPPQGPLVVHTHAGDGVGGQIDWDQVWADAVHSHASDAEGSQLAILTALSDLIHSHASDAQGGQLDWDSIFSDAVHSHASAGEGGQLAAADALSDLTAFLRQVGAVTTEATTTSSSFVDLLTLGDISIPVGTPFIIVVSWRKTSGEAVSTSVALKINGTLVGEMLQGTTTNRAETGVTVFVYGARATNHLRPGFIIRGNGTAPNGAITAPGDANMPNAAITEIILQGKVDSGTGTTLIGLAEMHVYALPV